MRRRPFAIGAIALAATVAAPASPAGAQSSEDCAQIPDEIVADVCFTVATTLEEILLGEPEPEPEPEPEEPPVDGGDTPDGDSGTSPAQEPTPELVSTVSGPAGSGTGIQTLADTGGDGLTVGGLLLLFGTALLRRRRRL